MRPSALPTVDRVRPISEGDRGPNGTPKVDALAVKDAISISKSGTLLGRLHELSTEDPERFKSLMGEGAREVRTGIEEGVLGHGATRFAENFEHAEESGAVADLDPRALAGIPAATPDSEKVAAALRARVDAALGIRLPPFGPWFPRGAKR